MNNLVKLHKTEYSDTELYDIYRDKYGSIESEQSKLCNAYPLVSRLALVLVLS